MAVPKIVARNFSEAHAFARDYLGLPVGRYRVISSSAALFGQSGDVYLVPGWDKRPDRFAIQNKIRYSRLNFIDVETLEDSAEEQDDDQVSNGDNMIAEGSPVTIFSDPQQYLAQTVVDSIGKHADDIAATAERLDQVLQDLATPSDDNESDFPEPEAAGDDDSDVKEDDSDKDVEIHDVDERHTPEEWEQAMKDQDEWQLTREPLPEENKAPLNGRRRRRCKDCGNLIHPDDVEDHARDHAADSVSLEKKATENLR